MQIAQLDIISVIFLVFISTEPKRFQQIFCMQNDIQSVESQSDVNQPYFDKIRWISVKELNKLLERTKIELELRET